MLATSRYGPKLSEVPLSSISHDFIKGGERTWAVMEQTQHNINCMHIR